MSKTTSPLAQTHDHAADKQTVTHTFKKNGYHRQIQTCTCGASRTVTVERAADGAALPGESTDWAHSESSLCS